MQGTPGSILEMRYAAFTRPTPFEYCVSNVRAQEKVDDAVQYDKISETSRIDVFDASVFATVRMLLDSEKADAINRWIESEEDSGIFHC